MRLYQGIAIENREKLNLQARQQLCILKWRVLLSMMQPRVRVPTLLELRHAVCGAQQPQKRPHKAAWGKRNKSDVKR